MSMKKFAFRKTLENTKFDNLGDLVHEAMTYAIKNLDEAALSDESGYDYWKLAKMFFAVQDRWLAKRSKNDDTFVS